MKKTIKTKEFENINLFKIVFVLEGYLILEKRYPQEFRDKIWKKILEYNINLYSLISQYLKKEEIWKFTGYYYNDIQSNFLDLEFLDNCNLLYEYTYKLNRNDCVIILNFLLNNYINNNNFQYYNNIFSFLRQKDINFKKIYNSYKNNLFTITVDFYSNNIKIYFFRKD